MKYERLKATLSKFDENEIEINNVYVAQLGCVRLVDKEKPNLSSRIPISDLEKFESKDSDDQKSPPVSISEIIYALEKHPNIFDISTPKKSEITLTMPSNEGILIYGDVFTLSIDLPARLHKMRMFQFDQQKPIEKFDVVASGSLFAAYVAVDDYPVWTHIGHEFREILKEQIEKETSFDCPAFGPSPIHPNFYFVFTEGDSQDTVKGMRIHSLHEDVFLIITGEPNTHNELLIRLLADIERYLLEFYSVQLARSSLLSNYVQVNNYFSDLSVSMSDLSAAPWYSIFKSTRCVNLARKTLTQVHTQLVQYQRQEFALAHARSEMLARVDDHRILSAIRNYLTGITQPDLQIPPALIPALQYFDRGIRTFAYVRLVLVASLSGAAIGAIVTAIFS